MAHLVWLTVNSSYSHSSLSLALIHSSCKDILGWEWSHVSVTKEEDAGMVAARLKGLQPSVVCAPLYLFNRNSVLDILGRLHALCPACRIWVGGPETLGEGRDELLAHHPYINKVVQGEGEGPMRALLSGAEEKAWDWENAPLPCLDEFYDFDKPFVQVETSRGCPNGCVFCTSAGTRVRYRSVESVRQELGLLHGRGIREIRLLDRTFNLPPHRAAALLQLFREEFGDIRFHLEIHPAYLSQEIREQLSLAKAGQLHLEAGIQTLQPLVLEAIGRPNTRDKALEGLGFLCSLPNVVTHTDLISGCPEQTLGSLYEDLETLLSLQPGEIQMEVMKILKGTVLAHNASKLGIIYSPNPPYDVMETPTMTAQEVAESRLLSRMLDVYYNPAPLRAAFTALGKHGRLRAFLGYLCGEKGFGLAAAPHLKKRFQWLQEFGGSYSDVSDALAQGWLQEAYPVGDGPARDSQWVHDLPEAVQEAFGPPSPTSRYARLDLHGGVAYYHYDRALAPNKAIGSFVVWQ